MYSSWNNKTYDTLFCDWLMFCSMIYDPLATSSYIRITVTIISDRLVKESHAGIEWIRFPQYAKM